MTAARIISVDKHSRIAVYSIELQAHILSPQFLCHKELFGIQHFHIREISLRRPFFLTGITLPADHGIMRQCNFPGGKYLAAPLHRLIYKGPSIVE